MTDDDGVRYRSDEWRIRFASDSDSQSIEWSIDEEEAFELHLGRLVRAMTELEDIIDGLLADLIPTPPFREAFHDLFLHGKGLSRKIDYLRKSVPTSRIE